jgi:hypothetical protein
MTPEIARATLQFLQRCSLMPNERQVFNEVEQALVAVAQSAVVMTAPNPMAAPAADPNMTD